MTEILKIIAKNKRAQFDYFIEEKFEAGLVLAGSEVKSIRNGKVALADTHAAASGNELYLYNCHIDEYDKAHQLNHQPKRPKKLLLKARQINRIIGKIKLKGYSFVALSLYFNHKNMIKIEMGLARGKKQHDKRQTLKEKDWKREQEKLVKNRIM